MATRQISLRRVSINGKRPCIKYVEDDGSLTCWPTLGYFQDASGAPPNASGGRFNDREWLALWNSGNRRLFSSNTDRFDTPEGPKVQTELQDGDTFERKGATKIVLRDKSGRSGLLSLQKGDFTERDGKLTANKMPKGMSLRDDMLTVDD